MSIPVYRQAVHVHLWLARRLHIPPAGPASGAEGVAHVERRATLAAEDQCQRALAVIVRLAHGALSIP